MQALHQEILPPSGVEFVTTLKLTPSTLPEVSPPSSASQDQPSRGALYNLVVARANILRVFEVKEGPVPISLQLEDERQRRADVRRGTEAVEGEVEMDGQGEGFINMGSVKVISDTLVFMFGPFPMTDICHHSWFPNPNFLGAVELIVRCRFLVYRFPRHGPPTDHYPLPFCPRIPTSWHSHRAGEHPHHVII
jgi:hypothetical protein